MDTAGEVPAGAAAWDLVCAASITALSSAAFFAAVSTAALACAANSACRARSSASNSAICCSLPARSRWFSANWASTAGLDYSIVAAYAACSFEQIGQRGLLAQHLVPVGRDLTHQLRILIANVLEDAHPRGKIGEGGGTEEHVEDGDPPALIDLDQAVAQSQLRLDRSFWRQWSAVCVEVAAAFVCSNCSPAVL